MDVMVLNTQQWLNAEYGNDARYNRIPEDGRTGWTTIHALIRALQIELGIQSTSNAFGPTTQARFRSTFPAGIEEQTPKDPYESNIYAIVQGSLWCKGYSTGSEITRHFYGGTGSAVKRLKADMGIGGDSTVDLEIIQALLSMKQFVLLGSYGAEAAVRTVQQDINRDYRPYTGILPTDGFYGREMNTALIQVLQAIEGFTPAEATGHFGAGTKARLVTVSAANAVSHPQWVWLAKSALLCNGHSIVTGTSWDDGMTAIVRAFQHDHALPETGAVDVNTWMSLLLSRGNPDRPAFACDTRFEVTSELLTALKSDGYRIVGRYLSEPDQDQKDPSQYFKAIRPGELTRITKGGLKFFPIYQEFSTALRHSPGNQQCATPVKPIGAQSV